MYMHRGFDPAMLDTFVLTHRRTSKARAIAGVKDTTSMAIFIVPTCSIDECV